MSVGIGSKSKYPRDLKSDFEVTMNGTESSSFFIEGNTLLAITLIGTVSGTIFTVQNSEDDITFYDLYLRNTELGGQYTIEVGSNRHIILDAIDTASLSYIKFISDASESGLIIKAVTGPVLGS